MVGPLFSFVIHIRFLSLNGLGQLVRRLYDK